jgi:hypothetical protein
LERIRCEIIENNREDAMAAKPDSKQLTPEAELRSYIARFDPKDQKLFRSVRTAVRKRLPSANELGYGYPDSVVISYSPTEGGIDGIAAIALRTDGVRLYLMNGPQLPDPKKLLQGSAKQVRFIQLEAASRLAHPDVKALIAAAIDQAKISLPSKGKGALIIKSSATKKRVRKKPTK